TSVFSSSTFRSDHPITARRRRRLAAVGMPSTRGSLARVGPLLAYLARAVALALCANKNNGEKSRELCVADVMEPPLVFRSRRRFRAARAADVSRFRRRRPRRPGSAAVLARSRRREQRRCVVVRNAAAPRGDAGLRRLRVADEARNRAPRLARARAA